MISATALGARDPGDDKNSDDKTNRTPISQKSGSGNSNGGTLSRKRKRQFLERLDKRGFEPPTIQFSHAGQPHGSEINPLSSDPNDYPGTVVWEDETERVDTTAAGNELVVADYFMQCFETDVVDSHGDRYYVFWAWAGCRPQPEILWDGNLTYAYIEYDITTENGDMKFYSPGSDKTQTGEPIPVGLTVNGGSPDGGLGASASIGGTMDIGGGKVGPHPSKMSMAGDQFCIRFTGSTENSTEVVGTAAATSPGYFEWDWDVDLDGERYAKPISK